MTFSPGIQMMLAGAILMIMGIVYDKWKARQMNRFNQNVMNSKARFKLDSRIAYYRARIRKTMRSVTAKEWCIVAISAILVVFTAGTGDLLRPAFGGVVIGVGFVVFLARSKADSERLLISKELAVFGECVDMYIRTGYQLNKAMQTAALSTPKIRPKVDICLRYWSAGPQIALEKLEDDLGIPEAETLIMILQSIEASGSANAKDTLDREAKTFRSCKTSKRNSD